MAYVPFLTILLPMRMTAIAGSGDVAWLAYATFAGAIAASLSAIVFGWASDRTRSRVPWIVAGLALSCALLLAFAAVRSVTATIALLIAWQCALNMMLAPLTAWAGDCVPNSQKGTLGGLLALTPAAGAMAGVIVTLPGLAGADARLALVAGMVLICAAPVIAFGRPLPFPDLIQDHRQAAQPTRTRATVARMWFARLLVQISEAALFALLYFWLRSIDTTMTDAKAARMFGVILLVAVPIAIAAGRWADRRDRPFAPLAATALISAGGLLTMAAAPGLPTALAGYVVFGLAATVFLSLHGAQTLRVLPRAAHRGRDIGIFNLTNTVPSLVMPWLALGLVPRFGFPGLFIALAGCALAAALLMHRMPREA